MRGRQKGGVEMRDENWDRKGEGLGFYWYAGPVSVMCI